MKKRNMIALALLLPALLLPGCARKTDCRAAAPSSSSAPAVSSSVSSAAPAASAPDSSAPAASAPAAQAQPVAAGGGRVVCIDPGHQAKVDLSTEAVAPGASVMKMKNPGGAEGVATQKPEYELNLEVSLKVRSLLQARGYTVVMTRETNGGDISNIGRAQKANDCSAGLFLRIHADSADSQSVTGTSIQIPGGDYIKDAALLSESRRAGQKILDAMLAQTGAKSRGLVERSDMTGFNWCSRPMVLVEMGFMSNPDEDKLMATDAYQQKLAQGMADGVDAFFAGK